MRIRRFRDLDPPESGGRSPRLRHADEWSPWSWAIFTQAERAKPESPCSPAQRPSWRMTVATMSSPSAWCAAPPSGRRPGRVRFDADTVQDLARQLEPVVVQLDRGGGADRAVPCQPPAGGCPVRGVHGLWLVEHGCEQRREMSSWAVSSGDQAVSRCGWKSGSPPGSWASSSVVLGAPHVAAQGHWGMTDPHPRPGAKGSAGAPPGAGHRAQKYGFSVGRSASVAASSSSARSPGSEDR